MSKPFGITILTNDLASQFRVLSQAARLWLMGVNIPKEQNMQALAKWLKVDQFNKLY
jgi:hypothetical protein